jgi:hypothetical protein
VTAARQRRQLAPGVPQRLLPFFGIAMLFLAVLWPYRNYVPIWDGRVYADCAIHAAEQGLSLTSLRCAGHPSQGYAFFLAASQLGAPGDTVLLHLTDIMLGLLAIASFRVVLARVFPGEMHRRSLDVVTLAAAMHPVLLSTLLQVNVDFGVYVFFFAALAALMSGYVQLTILFGALLCFSKETGVLAYGLMLALHAAFTMRVASGSMRERVERLLPLVPTLIPLALFAVYVLTWHETRVEPVIWKHGWQKTTIDGFNFFDLSDPIVLSYAAGIFVLGFGWVVTAIISADFFAGATRMAKRLPGRMVEGANANALAFVTVLTGALTYVLTSFRTWSNLRYFALLYPLILLLGYAALVRLRVPVLVRNGVFVALVLLFFVAQTRSIDPVSQRVYGTFSAGQKPMYRMSSITNEYHGPGRDELVYNLEFTGYHDVQNAFFARLPMTDSTAIATSNTVGLKLFAPLDWGTRRRTLRPTSIIRPRYTDEIELLADVGRPAEVWYLEFSNRPDNDRALESLHALYAEGGIVRTYKDGQLLVAHRLTLKAK